jgi:hypothetical protein
MMSTCTHREDAYKADARRALLARAVRTDVQLHAVSRGPPACGDSVVVQQTTHEVGRHAILHAEIIQQLCAHMLYTM